MPVRNGETLGDYFEWSYELFIGRCQAILERHAMRKFYSGEPEPLPDSYATCPQSTEPGQDANI